MTRDEFVRRPGEWIEPGVYFEMAISNRRLCRCDLPRDGVRGLYDPETGQRYWIRQERLTTTRPPALGNATV